MRGFWLWDAAITDNGEQALTVGADRDIRIWSLDHKQQKANLAFSYTMKKVLPEETSQAKTITCQKIFSKVENNPDKSVSDHDFEKLLQSKEGYLGTLITPHNAPIYSVILKTIHI